MAQRGVYRAVYSVLADDPDFQRLTPHARLVLYTARICYDSGPSALFRYYRGKLMDQTGLSAKALDSALVELEMGRWIERDATVLWVRNGLRYDPHISLADPKHRKAIERHLDALPRSQIVLRFCDYYQITRPFDGPPEAPPRPFEAVSSEKGVVSSEPEPDNTTPSPRVEEVWPSPQLLVNLYNAAAPDECPEVTKLSPRRRKKAQAYLAAFPDRKFWEETFGQIRASRFLRGLRPSNGHERFVADFDWLLTTGKDGSENCVKVYEGKYHD